MAKSSEHDGNTNPIGTKGYTGNPGGRPKMPEELKEAFRGHAETALQTLVDVMANGIKDGDRVKAAEVILDRGYGKARQAMELTGEDGGPVEIIKRIILRAGEVDPKS